MLHVRPRLFCAALTAAAMLLDAVTAPSAFAMSMEPESCREFFNPIWREGCLTARRLPRR
jgi:hypothetical protein